MLSVRRKPIVKKRPLRRTNMVNVNPFNTDDRMVSYRTGIRIPSYVNDYMRTFTQSEMNAMSRSNAEISTGYSVVFDKRTLKITRVENPPRPEQDPYATQRLVEYAIRTNLKSLTPKARQFVMRNWNGAIFIRIKKLVKTGNGSYQIPWHRDAHDMQMFGHRYKGFVVGALYINKPDLPGGQIQFARNAKRFGIAPPSGTSVTFFDDELFHRVTPVQAPPGVKYVPRTACFFVYGTSEMGLFKTGLRETHAANRNYQNFYKRLNYLKPIINKTNLNIQEKAYLNDQAKFLLNKPNATHTNLKTLYNNLKRTFNKNVVPYESKSFVAQIKPKLKVSQLTRLKLAKMKLKTLKNKLS